MAHKTTLSEETKCVPFHALCLQNLHYIILTGGREKSKAGGKWLLRSLTDREEEKQRGIGPSV